MNFAYNDWVTISGSQVVLEAGGYLPQPTAFEVETFAIDRYPVTNGRFAAFIANGGYTNPGWWCQDGWKLKEKEQWTEPAYWRMADWNRPDHPVVGVSWYEAMAFCRWLSHLNGQPITLPTEQKWQRAAQGEDGREYPWGNQNPHAGLCNWERTVDETTPVAAYPAGASPFGVMDMSGNVWEWCATEWENGVEKGNGRKTHLLRGGSWSSDSRLSLRAANRSPKDPNTRLSPAYRTHVTVGFRCVLGTV